MKARWKKECFATWSPGSGHLKKMVTLRKSSNLLGEISTFGKALHHRSDDRNGFHRSENGCEKVPENQSEKNKDTDDYLRAIFFHDGDKLETHFISP